MEKEISLKENMFLENEAEFFEKENQPFRTDKLFDASKLQSENNREVFDVARDIESHLEHIPEFVGLAPFGSRTKGYSKEGSDFDFCVLIDSPSAYVRDLDEILAKIKKEYRQKGQEVSFLRGSVRLDEGVDAFHPESAFTGSYANHGSNRIA